jgi:hypothetical protein
MGVPEEIRLFQLLRHTNKHRTDRMMEFISYLSWIKVDDDENYPVRKRDPAMA